MSSTLKMFGGVYAPTLTKDLVNADGRVLAQAGTKILVVPITTARAVMVGTSSLEDLWPTLSKTNHTHAVATQATAGFISAADKARLDTITAATATPKGLGTAAVGTSTKYAREDHVHPLQTTISGNAATATKATQDSKGQDIAATYIKGVEADGTTVTITKGDGTTATITTKDTTYSAATQSANGLLTAADKKKLDSITQGASAVSYTGTLNSGTKIGTLTINGTENNIYCDTNTDTLVTQNVSTDNNTYPLLATPTANATANQGAKTAIFSKSIKINPSSGEIVATKFTGAMKGNADTATKATSDSEGQNIASTYIKGVEANGTTVTITKGDGTTATITTKDTTYSAATQSNNGLLTAADKTKLDSINQGATAVSFSGLLNEGTKIGTITINGTENDIYCETNTNTDTLVTQNVSTDNNTYPILATSTANANANQGAKKAIFASSIKINPSTGELTALKFIGPMQGNADTATKASQDSEGQNIASTYIKGLSVNGKTITFTKGDGTTGTFTTQDTNTTYSVMGAATADAAGTQGLVPAPAKGDQTKVLSGAGTWVTNTGDTHWTTKVVVGGNTATENAATTNGNTYLRVFDNTTERASLKISGSGATTVTSDASGNITVKSVNTTYNAASTTANGLMSKEDKAKLDGIAEGAQTNSITGVKGNAESSYRTGEVNLTPDNIGAAAKSHKHAASDITGTLSADRIPNLDASKITSGTIDIARLPASAIERLVTVTDATARLKLTTASVQVGDTVKETSTGKMYFVVDDTKLNSEDGYVVYTAGSASSVPWSGITGKPSSYYTHPTHTAYSAGLYKVTVNNLGHVTAATAVTKDDITGLGIPASNTTYSNFVKSGSGAKAGLVPAPSTTAGTTKYLREDGTWSVPPDNNTTYNVMGAATADAAGTSGLVPAPAKGDQAKVLSGAGTWVTNTGDTHWTTTLYAGAKDAKSNAVTTNGNAYIKLFDNNTARSQLNIKGTGAATVVTDANGTITVNATNTTYSAGTGLSLSGTTFSVASSSGTSTLAWNSEVTLATVGGMAIKAKLPANPNTNTWIAFVGATADADGTAGYVPAPGKGNQAKFFRADGTWQVPTDTNNATAQNISTTNNTYPVLFGATANATANIGNKATYFSKDVKINPSTGVISALGFSGPLTGNATNVTGTVAIEHGGTGATTRLGALKNLTNENVGSSSQYFLTITKDWAKGGYASVADAKTVLGLKSAAYTESSAYAAASHTHSYLPLSGGTVTGTLILSRTTDTSGTADNKPALIVGGASTAAHIEIDANEIIAKASGTTVSALNLNTDGGVVNIGSGGLKTTGNITIEKSGPQAVFQDTRAVKGTAPTSNIWNQFFFVRDKNGVAYGGLEHGFKTTLENRMNLIVYQGTTNNTSTNAQIAVGYDADGNWFTYAPTPADADNSTKMATTAWVRKYSETTKKFLTAHQSLANYSTLANTIKALSISGKTITYTRGDGTTGTITTQDTNTTYSNFVKSGSGAKAGLVPAPSTTAGTTKYLREDGTWQVPPNTNTTYSAGAGLALSSTTFNVTALPSRSTPIGNGLTYCTGSLTIGTANGNLFKGSSNNANLVSAPENGTYYNSTSGNVQNLRLTWSTDGKYLTDIFASPNNDYLWHRNVVNGTAKGWRRLVEENVSGITAPSWDISISGTATKATQDSAGQQINTTYIKGLSVSGRTITYTKGDGTTGTITTQDNNTWTAFKGATSSAAGTAGYVPAPAKGDQAKFFKADGTWAVPTDTKYSAGTGLTLSGTKFSVAANIYAAANHTHNYLPLSGGSLTGGLSIINTSIAARGTKPTAWTNRDIRFLDNSTNALERRTLGWIRCCSGTGGEINMEFKAFKPDSTADTAAGLIVTYPYSGNPYISGITPAASDNSTKIPTTAWVRTATGNTSLNAATATKLATARTIALSGAVTGAKAFDGSGNITIPTSLKTCYVIVESEAVTNNIFKFGTVDLSGAYIGYTVYILVQSPYNHASAIWQITINAGNTAGVFGSGKSTFINNNGLNVSNFFVGYKNNSGSKINVALYCKVAERYNGYRFTVISEVCRYQMAAGSGEFLILTNKEQAAGTAAVDSGFTVINTTNATVQDNITGNAATATKATQDSAGQQINKTYIKGLSVSGRTITYTKGDGTTGTITTQDNNTTYSAGTGLTLSGTTFSVTANTYAAASHTHSYLPISGGTLTGDVTIQKANPVFYLRNTSKTRGTAPSAAVNTVEINGRDNANKNTWGIYQTYGTDKSIMTYLITYKGTTTDNAWTGIGVGYNASGAIVSYAPTPGASDNSTQISTTAWVRTYCETTKKFLTSHQSLANYLPLKTNVSELGRYIDLHFDNATAKYDYDVRMYVNTQGSAAGKGDFYITANTCNFGNTKLSGQLQVNRDNSGVGGGIRLSGASQNFAISIISTGLTKGTAPTAAKYTGIDFYGNTVSSYKNRIGMIEHTLETNNTSGIHLRAYNCTSAENTATSTISAYVDGSGNAYTAAPTPAANDCTTKIATTAWVKNSCANTTGADVSLSGTEINVSNGSTFTKTISANTTFTITGVPSGRAATFSLVLTNGGSKTVTWPSSVKWAGGSVPALTSSGTDVLTFLTNNGGSTWYGVASSIKAS